jgi:hypothetical protein
MRLACFLLLVNTFLSTQVESKFEFNPSGAIPIQDGDFSEYVDIFNIQKEELLHYLSLSGF